MMSDKAKALELAIGQIEKQFGKGSVMRLGEASSRLSVDAIPTGALTLDLALGVGGVPRGRIIEIFGNEASGKTTLAYHIVAEAQKRGGTAAFIDAEHALDPAYAKAVGVNVDELLLSQPDTGEQALDIADMLVRSGAIDIFVVDSVAALVPQTELEGEMGDSHVGLQARLMSKAMRKLSGSLATTRTVGVFLNQLREKIGIMFGNPEVTPGGRALKFWSSVRIELRRVENLKSGTQVIGARSRARVVKNKVAPPFRQAEFDMIYGKGISHGGCILDVGLGLGLITKSGAFLSYGDTRLGQGRENARETLESNAELAQEIEDRIRQQVGADGASAADEDDAAAEE
ncbi:MAG: recombinase RecA [Armatimonadota bacterium]|nr:MAG: recombinase RecA [Armatimonadota bacterium]